MIWMAWCEHWLRNRVNGRNTCSSPWSWHDRCSPIIPLKWLQQRVYLSFLHISPIRSGSCDHLDSGTREWIYILSTGHPILPNTNRPFWGMWRMNNVPNIDKCRSVNTKAYQGVISSPRQRLQDLVDHLSIHIIRPAQMKNTIRLSLRPRQHPENAITQNAYWPRPGSIWIRHLKHRRTGGQLIPISLSTSPTQWRLAVHFRYRT